MALLLIILLNCYLELKGNLKLQSQQNYLSIHFVEVGWAVSLGWIWLESSCINFSVSHLL